MAIHKKLKHMTIDQILEWYKGTSPYLRITRPPLAFLGFFSALSLLVWVGDLFTVRGLLIILCITCINIGFNIVSDIVDKDDDAINKPWRPIPSGAISIRNASIFANIVFFIGVIALLILTVYYDIFYLLIGGLAVLAGIRYNRGKHDLVANMCVGIMYGIAVYMPLYPTHFIFALAFGLYSIGHNIAVQTQDIKYDKNITLSQQIGPTKALTFALICTMLAIIFFIVERQHVFLLPTIASATGIGYYLFFNQDEQIFELTHRFIARILIIFAFLVLFIISLF